MLLTLLTSAVAAAHGGDGGGVHWRGDYAGDGPRPLDHPAQLPAGRPIPTARPRRRGGSSGAWTWATPTATGTESFLQSYTYRSATGADADALWNDAVAETGLGEMDAITQENVKWMMSYIADYTGEIPGSLFMALQTYIWDNQSDKSRRAAIPAATSTPAASPTPIRTTNM